MEPHNNNFIARKYKNFDQARSDEMCLFFFLILYLLDNFDNFI